MKRILSVFLASAVVVAFAGVSLANPRPVEKLKDGATEVIKSPKILKDDVMTETKDAKFLPFALVGGISKDAFYMTKGVVHGTYIMLTSPLEVIK